MARSSSDKHSFGAGNGSWLLDRVQQAFWQVAVGWQFVTISRIFQNLPHVCRHLIQNTGRAAKVSDQEILVFSANLWKRIYTSPHRWSLSKTHFLHWYIQGWSEKREGGRKGCELRIVGKIYSLARGHRHRHETSDWTGRDTNTALHNPTVGRQHTHSKRLFHTPWTSPYTVLRCTLFWRISEQLALLCRRSGVNMTIFQGLCLAASDLETHSPAVIFTHRGGPSSILIAKNHWCCQMARAQCKIVLIFLTWWYWWRLKSIWREFAGRQWAGAVITESEFGSRSYPRSHLRFFSFSQIFLHLWSFIASCISSCALLGRL